jgi:hypothetical protein
MLIFCGLTQGRTHDSLKQLLASKLNVSVPPVDKIYFTPGNLELKVSEFIDGDFVLWVASYPATEFTPDLEYLRWCKEIYAWGGAFLPAEISRILGVDCDEFLYVKKPEILENLDNLGFHFVDMVPSPVWPPKELKFSLQGWYYRRQTRPIFKYGKFFTLPLAKMVGRGLEHSGCKNFNFDRKHLATMNFSPHGITHSLCCCGTLNRFLNNPNECREILHDTAFCYHLGMTCKEYFLSEKLRLFARLQTDSKKGLKHELRGMEAIDLKAAEKTFDRFISKSIFPVIEDNFLLPYLQMR